MTDKKPVSKEELQKAAVKLIKAQLEFDNEIPRILETLKNASNELREIYEHGKVIIAQVGGVLYSVKYNTKQEYYFTVIKAIDTRKGSDK